MQSEDININDTHDIHFTTRRFSTGAPHSLASGVVSAYVGNTTAGITTGITLSTNLGSVVGLNLIRIVATTTNGYSDNTEISLAVTTGTVDSVSVVGEVVGRFTIGKAVRLITDDATRLDGSRLNLGIPNVAPGTTSGLPLVGSQLPLALTGGKVESNVGTITNDAITAASIATGAIDADAIADNAIDAGAIAANAITSTKVADGFLTAAKFASGAFDAVWTVTTRELTAFSASFKTGYALSAAGVQAIWDALTAALTTAGSIGKLLVDNINTDLQGIADTVSNVETIVTNIDTNVDTVLTELAAIDTEIAAIKAKTDNLPEGVKKNTALSNFMFFMADSVDHVTGLTGLTVSPTRSLDGAAFAACANSVTEVGFGWYKINLATTDTNADIVTIRMTAGGADDFGLSIKTEV